MSLNKLLRLKFCAFDRVRMVINMKLTVREVCILGLLGALMYASKAILAFIPNVHLVGVFVVAITVIYRRKALYAIYVFVLLSGLFDGFGVWWLSYLYIWLPLWGLTMLMPKNMKNPIKPFAYMCICALHGFLYGLMYAPFQAVIFGMSFDAAVAWIIAGLPYDLVHGISNFFCGLLICPIVYVIRRVEKN